MSLVGHLIDIKGLLKGVERYDEAWKACGGGLVNLLHRQKDFLHDNVLRRGREASLILQTLLS